ncbi:MAG: hypothetical protein J0L73_27285 [Verrucomicrobia bacterium]|nr:hypothetical protein [Verrucomicrobiota bacterium]
MAFLRKTFTGVVGVTFLMLARLLPAADSPFTPEVQQRLDLLKTGYETFVLNNSTIPYETGLKTLNERVKPVLERESAAAAQRTDLNTLARIKSDLERLEKNEVLTAETEAPPEPLKHTYIAYKLELDKLESAQKASLADAKRRYDKGLENVQNELTKAQEVAAALQIKQLREALADAPAPSAATPLDPEQGAGGNLLANPTFKNGMKMWELSTHDRSVEVKEAVDKKVLFHDQPTLRVTNPGVTDTHIAQKVKVKPNTRYLISGWIKTEDIKDANGGTSAKRGACLCITGKYGTTTSFVNSDTWMEVSKEFKSQDETEMLFECRLGYFSATVSGTAWFAAVSLKEVTDAAAKVKADQ